MSGLDSELSCLVFLFIKYNTEIIIKIMPNIIQLVFFILIDLWLIILKHKKIIKKSQIQELTDQTMLSLHLLH